MVKSGDANATTAAPWWSPGRHRDRRPLLLARGRIQTALRGYFASEGFTEVETAQLQVSPGNETHLHGLRADLLTLAEAFTRDAGIDLLATTGDREALAGAVAAIGIHVTPDDTWSDLFSKVLTHRIERKLGIGRPLVLCEYPVSEAALARAKPIDPRVAERFELYACGVELANAFRELTDPVEQRARFEADMVEKQRLYDERYPIDEDFLAALAEMPEASGAALGFDRLVMLATGADRIEQVLWTPVA